MTKLFIEAPPLLNSLLRVCHASPGFPTTRLVLPGGKLSDIYMGPGRRALSLCCSAGLSSAQPAFAVPIGLPDGFDRTIRQYLANGNTGQPYAQPGNHHFMLSDLFDYVELMQRIHARRHPSGCLLNLIDWASPHGQNQNCLCVATNATASAPKWQGQCPLHQLELPERRTVTGAATCPASGGNHRLRRWLPAAAKRKVVWPSAQGRRRSHDRPAATRLDQVLGGGLSAAMARWSRSGGGPGIA